MVLPLNNYDCDDDIESQYEIIEDIRDILLRIESNMDKDKKIKEV